MFELLKMEYGWGMFTKDELKDYIPDTITEAEYKEITGEDLE